MTDKNSYFSPLEDAIANSRFEEAVPPLVDQAVKDLFAFGFVVRWLGSQSVTQK